MAELLSASDHEVVSCESELLILVDEQDREIGHGSKAALHDGDGVLHRAFSLFIFNEAGELLLQQRSAQKRLWPMFWSNSCCSHPRRGETMDQAVHRRLEQELGMTSALQYLYKFRYQAQFGEIGAEHEFCWVYAGVSSDPVRVNKNEINAWRYIDEQSLNDEMEAQPESFTPWFTMEWQRIRRSHRHQTALHSVKD